jgi:hypothetical protein
MKIIFYSQDAKLKTLAKRLINVEWSFCEQLDELKFEYEQQPDDQVWVYFLDFACSTKNIDQFSKNTYKDADVLRFGLIEEDNFKEIRKHQKTKLACHSYLLKPIDISTMENAISEYLEGQGYEVEGEERFKLEAQTHVELVRLDEDKEDYDTTQSSLVLPEGFQTQTIDQDNNLSRATYIDSNPSDGLSMINDDELLDTEEDEDFEVFEAQELKINADVKNLVNEHTTIRVVYNFDEDPVCQRIQQKFSAVFGDEQEQFDDDEPLMEESASAGLRFDGVNDDTVESESLSINFNLDEDSDESEVEPAMKEAPKNTKTQEEVKELDSESGLDFSHPDDEQSNEITEESTMASSKEVATDVESDELEFDDEEIKFEATVEIDIAKTWADGQSNEDHSDDGLVFDIDEVTNVALAPENEDKDEVEEDDEDFSVRKHLNKSGIKPDEEESLIDSAADDFSDLNIAEDDDVDPTVLAKVNTSSFSIDGSTSDNLERTISEIVKGPDEKEDADLEEMGEFELGEEIGFTDDELASIKQDDGSDNTQATLIIGSSPTLSQSQGSQMSSDDESNEFNLASMIDEDTSEADFNLGDEIEEEDYQISRQEDDEAKIESKSTRSEPQQNRDEQYSRPIMSYNDDELLRLQSTIKSLREEREEHLRIIGESKNELKLQMSDSLGLKAELDEARIEISIIKKRHLQELEEYRYQLGLAEEKKLIFEERCKTFQKEFDRLNQKVRLEFNQVKQREKELESQLELITMDSEAQVQARDNKILELKRKIDALEFNMENVTIREEKTKEDKMKVEDKIAKIMTTLRGSIKLLEDDADIEEQLKVRLNDKQDK